VLIDDGIVTMVDEAELLRKAEISARAVFQRAGVNSRLTRESEVS